MTYERARRPALALLIVVSTSVPIWTARSAPPAEGKEIRAGRALAEKRRAEAQRAYDLLFEPVNKGIGRYPQYEPIYLWSRRIAAAECDLADTPSGKMEAYQAHLERMTRLSTRQSEIESLAPDTALQKATVEYYVSEAGYWVERAHGL